ncbi:MAG: GTPase HflX [Candidatus Omnitrophica bacterium]|nr:GTPase HflX [Candidatus Omnitrophota bacterium]
MKESQLVESADMERVLLVMIDFKNDKQQWQVEDNLFEMQELVVACGGEVIESVICPLSKPSAATLINKGKVDEIITACSAFDIDTVIFSEDLKGSQQRNLEESIKLKTIDRTQLILDIFAKNATSKEGKMQVELAQLEYLLPRLVGKGVELSRLGGGIGTLGPGETKLEVDRRRIGQRIDKLKKELKEVAAGRQLKRKKRKDQGVPSISLVGYTNAGKSTLLNTLTQAGQKTKDGLFTTLDSLSRQLALPNHQKVVLSDTVGFMHQLPHRLIEAFKATLEEVKEADLLLHVLDGSHPRFRDLYESVCVVLRELEAMQTPTLVVINKADHLESPEMVAGIQSSFENSVAISALKKQGIDLLLEKIMAMLAESFEEIHVDIPINRMDLVNLAHKEGEVFSVKYYNDRINIRASIPVSLKAKFIFESI